MQFTAKISHGCTEQHGYGRVEVFTAIFKYTLRITKAQKLRSEKRSSRKLYMSVANHTAWIKFCPFCGKTLQQIKRETTNN